jgi:hypothetical protein
MYFLVSIYSNILSVSLLENGHLNEKTIPVDATIVHDSNINNITEFTKILFNALYDMKGSSYKHIPVVFITDPTKTFFRYIKSQKELNFDNQTSQIFSELNITPDDYYFSVFKISPFVSQFVASRKTDIDKYITIANEIECDLKGVFSYLPLVAKYVSHNGNLIIISSYLGEIVVGLSEMNGIYFNDKYGSFKDANSVKKMVENLKMFKSSTHDNKLISFNFENPMASAKLGIPELNLENEYNYSNPIHNLASKILAQEYIDSHYNLINSYFEKSREIKKPSKAVIVAFAFSLVGLVFAWAYNEYIDNSFFQKVAVNVLGDSSQSNTTEEEKETTLNRLPEPPADGSTPVSQGQAVGSQAIENKDKDELDLKELALNQTSDTEASKAEYKRENYKMSILNSTGISGLAKKTSDRIGVLGYKNIQIGTSNTPQSGNLIKIKPSLSVYKDKIMKDFDLIELKDLKIEETLGAESAVDILLILGK